MYHIYIHQTLIQDELETVFQNLNYETKLDRRTKDILKVSIEPSITEELIDFDMLHASIVSDFDMDTALIYLDGRVFDFIDESFILDHISKMKHQVYDVSKLLIYLSHYLEIKYQIRRKIVDLLGQEYINTMIEIAKSNMNFSIAAKHLYLHRNSLNYRIDKINQKTSIDVKTFHGLRAILSIIEG